MDVHTRPLLLQPQHHCSIRWDVRCGFAPLLLQVSALFRGRVEERMLTLKVTAPPESEATLRGDPNRLRQVSALMHCHAHLPPTLPACLQGPVLDPGGLGWGLYRTLGRQQGSLPKEANS